MYMRKAMRSIVLVSVILLMVGICTTNAENLPSTFTFINKSYTGTRFSNKVVVVAGGTSGIGFASAAMFIQECAKAVYLLGQNVEKGKLAKSVISNVGASLDHCKYENDFTERVFFLRTDIRNRTSIRNTLNTIHSMDITDNTVHVLVNTAGIAGWVDPLPSIPDDAWFGENDSIYNNLYGTIFLMSEMTRFWNMDKCRNDATGTLTCPELGFTPAIVNVASEQGLTPTPTLMMYGVSKAGIIQATRTLAETFPPPALRVNVVAPGLVSTPLTWNQARGYTVENKSKLNDTYPGVQFGFECVSKGKDGKPEIIEGDCQGGGKGSPGCPCPDLQWTDPRVQLLFGQMKAMVDPRRIGAGILYLASEDANQKKVTGETYVIDHLQDKDNDPGTNWSCGPLVGPPLQIGQCCGPSKPLPPLF